MSTNRLLLSMLMIVALLGFQSCSKDDDDNKPESKKVVEMEDIDATDYKKWVYISLEKREIVGTSAETEKREGKDWDIAFHRCDVRLNGGESGEGKAAAYLAPNKIGKTGWDAITEAPEDGYISDEKMKVLISMPPEYSLTTGSKVITGGGMGKKGTWVNFNHEDKTYTVTNQIFIIKTAAGKYGKLWLKQFVNANKKSGHITFKFEYL